MSNAKIRSGFESLLATWAAAQSPPIPIAYQNKTFTPPEARYIRAFLLPGQTDSRDIDGEQRIFVGVFQVTIYVPLGTGAGAAQALEDAICARYPKEDVIVSGGLHIRLTRPMSAGPSFTDATHYSTPISCAYQAII